MTDGSTPLTALLWNDPLEFPGSSQTIKLTISNQELFDVS